MFSPPSSQERPNKAASSFPDNTHLRGNKSRHRASFCASEFMDLLFITYTFNPVKLYRQVFAVRSHSRSRAHTDSEVSPAKLFCPVVEGFEILCPAGLEVGGTCAASTAPVCNAETASSRSLIPTTSPLVILETPRRETAALFIPLPFERMWSVFTKSYFLSVRATVLVCMLREGGSLLICCLLCCVPALLPPPPLLPPVPFAPSPRSQVWPEGSPSILTGVSKEVSVAILFSTPSLPEQRCCTKQPAAGLVFVFSYSPEHLPHPVICSVMLHHFIPGSRPKGWNIHYESRANVLFS